MRFKVEIQNSTDFQLDNIKSATLTVMARAKKDRNEYQEQFVRFIDSVGFPFHFLEFLKFSFFSDF